jgi:cellulose synthase A
MKCAYCGCLNAFSAHVRIVDHSRDFSSYGFGNVAWKERVESWKNKQEKNMLQVTNSGDYASEGKGGDMDFGGGENEDLQMYALSLIG